MKINIISKSEKGRIALIEHHKDSLKMPPPKRAMMKIIGIKQELVSTEPYNIQISFGKNISNLMNPEHIILEVDKFMKTQKVKRKIDYEVVIDE